MSRIKNILILSALVVMIATATLLSGCFNSSSGGLTPTILSGNTGSGSGGSSFSSAVAFDDISDDSGATFIDPDNDFDGPDDGLYTISGGLPFNFTLFGSSNSTFNAGNDIIICTNGFFSFDSDVESDDFDAYDNVEYIPAILVGYDDGWDSYGPYNSFIAPFWDDIQLISSEGHGVWYITRGTAPNRQFVIQWYAEGYDANQRDNQLIFQAILFEGSNDIQFSYAIMNDVNGNDTVGYGGARDGSSATIGVMVGEDNEPNALAKIYSINIAGSIPTIPSNQAYYIYFKANGQNYDIYTGFTSATINISLDSIALNKLGNRTNNKPESSISFSWFYQNNTPQEFWNFVNQLKQNSNNNRNRRRK